MNVTARLSDSASDNVARRLRTVKILLNVFSHRRSDSVQRRWWLHFWFAGWPTLEQFGVSSWKFQGMLRQELWWVWACTRGFSTEGHVTSHLADTVSADVVWHSVTRCTIDDLCNAAIQLFSLNPTVQLAHIAVLCKQSSNNRVFVQYEWNINNLGPADVCISLWSCCLPIPLLLS